MLLTLVVISTGVVSAADNGNISSTYNNSDHSLTKSGTDTTPPVKWGSDPTNNALNVPVNKTIKINFNEPIKFGNSWIELISRGGIKSPIKKSINGNTLTIKTTGLMVKGTNYTLLIHTGSVKDLSW